MGREFADETGTTITGLEIGEAYYISPPDCFSCHESDHGIIFHHWDNGSPERQRPFTILSSSPPSGGAYHEFVKHGESPPDGDKNGSGSNGGSSGGGDNGAGYGITWEYATS